MRTIIATAALALCVSVAAPASAEAPTQAAPLSEASKAKAKAVQDAINACKADAAAVASAFGRLSGKKTGTQVRSVVGGLMGRWTSNVKRLDSAVKAWGKKPHARSVVGGLMGKVTALNTQIAGLPAGKNADLGGLKRQQQAARNKQSEAMGILEPVIYR